MFVLLGSNGQITAQIACHLLDAGHPVRVVGRSPGALSPLANAGARIAAGDPGDPVFLARAFEDATAVYTMIPPCYDEPNMRAAQDRIGTAIAQALRRARVQRVVNLSSIGAERPQGTGPIEGLHAQEKRLDAIGGMHLLHLRPGSFMENLLPAAATVAAADILPGLEAADAVIPMVATRDIAAVAAEELTTPRHQGQLILHAARHVSMREAAAALGKAIGKPNLPYVQSEPAAARVALLAHGLSADAADQLAALARWLSTAPLDSVGVAPVAVQPTTIEAFARERFAAAFAEAQRAALGSAHGKPLTSRRRRSSTMSM